VFQHPTGRPTECLPLARPGIADPGQTVPIVGVKQPPPRRTRDDAIDLGCAKTKSDLVVIPCGGRRFFCSPRDHRPQNFGVFAQARPVSDIDWASQQSRKQDLRGPANNPDPRSLSIRSSPNRSSLVWDRGAPEQGLLIDLAPVRQTLDQADCLPTDFYDVGARWTNSMRVPHGSVIYVIATPVVSFFL
jgi:hypothetical protein